MFSPAYTSFLTNNCFTQLAFCYGNEWIGFSNPFTKEQYELMRDTGCPPNEVLQRLVHENILKLCVDVGGRMLLVFKNNVLKLVNRCVISKETVHAKYWKIPSSFAPDVMIGKISEESTESEDSSDDIPDLMSGDDGQVAPLLRNSISHENDGKLNDISENGSNIPSIIGVDNVNKPALYEIPYDIIIDMQTTNPDDFNLKNCYKQFKEHYGLTDEMLLKTLLKREPSDENNKRIAKMFDIRFETNLDVKYDLPVAEFEEYLTGYLMELFLDKLANKMHYIVDMKKNSKLYDLVRVIKETNVDRKEIHAVINAIMAGDCINKAETIAAIVKELI
jgi:hypothetical protein